MKTTTGPASTGVDDFLRQEGEKDSERWLADLGKLVHAPGRGYTMSADQHQRLERLIAELQTFAVELTPNK